MGIGMNLSDIFRSGDVRMAIRRKFPESDWVLAEELVLTFLHTEPMANSEHLSDEQIFEIYRLAIEASESIPDLCESLDMVLKDWSMLLVLNGWSMPLRKVCPKGAVSEAV